MHLRAHSLQALFGRGIRNFLKTFGRDVFAFGPLGQRQMHVRYAQFYGLFNSPFRSV